MQASHENKFDMLRGLASMAVLIPHVAATFLYRLLGPDHPIALAAGTIARHAVLVFFLLSGFLITLSVAANVQRNGRFDVTAYLVARIARIYPPLVGTILIVLIAYALIHGLSLPGAVRYGIPSDLYAVRNQFAVRPIDVLFAMLMHNGMLDADGPLWSLYVEFHLYIAALFVALAVTATNAVKRTVSAALAVGLLVWWTMKDTQFVFFMLVWALGGCISLWHAQMMRSGFKKVFAGVALIGVVIHVALAILVPEWLAIDKPIVWVSYGVQLAACVSYAYVIFVSPWGQQPSRWLVKSGEYSYSLYVIHFPILLLILSLTQGWMGNSLWRSVAVAIVSTAVTILAARVFAEFFEDQRRFKPLIRATLEIVLRAVNRTAPT